MTDVKPGSDRGYRRSWKNLLINKRYQLRFTLFMVGLAAVLMVGLGVWVMRVANETTEVSAASVRGKACPKLPSLDDNAAAGDDEGAPPRTPMKLDGSPDGSIGDSPSPAAAASEPAPAAAPAPAPAPDVRTDAPGTAATPAHGKPRRPTTPAAGSAAGSGSADDDSRHVKVQIDESSMTIVPRPVAVPADLADRVTAHWTCELQQVAKLDLLERDRRFILWAMIGTGLLLVLGLAAYGIKMTHRVAGPLFKVSLYLSKMRAGRFDKVYNLRKGDQLVEFYDHFKLAHDGVVAMQRDDIARLAAVIAAAEAAGTGGHPAVVELRELLAQKEKSIA